MFDVSRETSVFSQVIFSVPAVVFCRKHRRHSTCLYKAYFEGWVGCVLVVFPGV